MQDTARLEPALEPELPIIDPHHHLWSRPSACLNAMGQDNQMMRALLPTFRRYARYLLDEFVRDLRTGHNVRATVYLEAHSTYRASGPEESVQRYRSTHLQTIDRVRVECPCRNPCASR